MESSTICRLGLTRNATKEKKGSLVAQSMLSCPTIVYERNSMIATFYSFIADKILLIGAFIGGLYVFWLKRSQSKAKEEARDAQIVSLQAKATQDQVETLVEKAQNVMAQQTNVECSVCDRVSINRWLSEESNISSTDPMSKASHAKDLPHDTATISKPPSKTGR